MDEGRALAVREVVSGLWAEELRFLQDLIRRGGVRGQTNPVQGLVEETLAAHGLDIVRVGIDIESVAGRRGFSPVDWSYNGLFNVVGHARGTGGGRSLVLNGHVDVVSPEPVAHWSRDPWEPWTDGERMYGRGSADMKGGVAAMIFALRAVREAGVPLQGDVVVQSVIDEECSGNGTLACLEAGHGGDAAAIPEPTGLGFVTAHPGVLWCRIVVRGLGAHARQASAAINAIDKAHLLVGALRELEREWNAPGAVHPALRELDHPINFNLGTIQGGDWPSTVPQECVVGLRLSCQPGSELDEVKREVLERVRRASETDDWLRTTPPTVSFNGFHAEPAVYDLDTPIHHTVAAAHVSVTGRPVVAGPSSATFDSRIFELAHGIPTVLYGPVGDRLHGTDEWVDLASVRTVTEVLATTVCEWCGSRP